MPVPSDSASPDPLDVWLDAALAGAPEDPDAFCDRHGVGGEDRAAIERLHSQLRGGRHETTAADDLHADFALAGADNGSERALPFPSLGGARLLRRLGEGGMGSVFLAEQPELDRLVALKVLRPELVGSPAAARRLAREARAVARLRHPNVVRLFAAGEENGIAFLIMELVPGRGLDEVLAAGPVPTRQLVQWGLQVAEGLAAAHAEGIVHRDVKPSNIRIDPTGRAVLLDFGLARDALAESGDRTVGFAGTPEYAAPEQLLGSGDAVDHRADVFSLGLLLECGASGVEGEPIAARALTRDLAVVVGKATERDPDARYPTMAAFAADLRAILDLRPIAARPPSRAARALRWARRHRATVVTGCVGLAAVALLAISAWRAEASRRAQRRETARMLVDEARREVAAYADRRDRFAAEAEHAYRLGMEREARYLTPDEARFLELHSVRREVHWGASEVLASVLQQKLHRAQELDPEAPGIAAVWVAYWFQRWWDLRTSTEWRSLRRFFRRQVEAFDVDGVHGQDLVGGVRLGFVSDPPGAAIHLFRCVEQAELGRRLDLGDVEALDGDRRLVPVPFAVGVDGSAPAPGTLVFEVVRDSGGLRRGDWIVAVGGRPVELGDIEVLAEAAGATPVAFWRAGARHRSEVRGAVAVRARFAAAVPQPDSLLGTAPIASMPLEAGEYRVVLSLEGYEDLHLPIVVPLRRVEEPLHRVYRGRLLPVGSTPDGFVRVSDARGRWPGFFVQEREVTCGEYLQFLADADGRSRVGGLVPRPLGREPWTADDSDGFALPAGLGADVPVTGVSWRDADAYARWWGRERTLELAGQRYRVRLPTRAEWRRAAGAVNTPSHRTFVFGDYFCAHWCNGRFSRPEPVLESAICYPIDRSPFGVLGTAGGAAEWCSGHLDQAGRLRPLVGGSWQDSAPDAFRIDAVRGLEEDAVGLHTGFRLAWVVGDPQ